MVVTVMGGLAFQVPVGRLSDRFDRRIVLAGLGLGFAAAAIVAVRLPRTPFAILPVAVLLGGLMRLRPASTPERERKTRR